MKKAVSIYTMIIAALFCATFLLSFFGSVYWVFDLLSHFYMHYLWGGMILLIFFLVLKKWIEAGVIASILIVLCAIVFHANGVFAENQKVQNQDVVEVYFSNIEYGNTDIDRITASIQERDAEVLFFVEMTKKQYDALILQLPEYRHHSYTQGRGAFDVAVFSRIAPLDTTVHYFSESDEPSVEVVIEKNGKILSLIATHPAPPLSDLTWQRRNTQLQGAAAYMNTREHPAVLFGDFNNTPFSSTFQKILTEQNLTDSRNGYGNSASWPTFFPSFFRIPIDHALLTDGITIAERAFAADTGSDHKAFFVQIVIE